jgi:transposase
VGKLKPEGYTLARRMLKFTDNHLLFMCDLGVPFENNMSERLLRGAKKKIKQSGGFRSTKNGEQPYCDFLTITETAKLRGQSPFAAVKMIFEA